MTTNVTAAPNWHGQLAANVITEVTLPGGPQVYEIVNVDGASRIDYTIDGTAPVVGGSVTGRVLPASSCADVINVKSEGGTVVSLISAGAPHFSVECQAGPV